MVLSDFFRNFRQPRHVYKMGAFTFYYQHIKVIFLTTLLVFLCYYFLLFMFICPDQCKKILCSNSYEYNSTYPLSKPLNANGGITFRIAVVSDLDTNSKNDKKNTWISLLKKGWLTWTPKNNFISVRWDSGEINLSSTYTLKNRGMELSELIIFDGHLLTFDDRTGLVYRIENDEVYPWLILMDGDGKKSKGFKSEWAAVKHGKLYVGSMGKEWTSASGEFSNYDPMWTKVIAPDGLTKSLNWVDNYKRLRKSLNIKFPGYVIHESGAWSNVHNSWFFLPRRCSAEQYNETKDEVMSCNVLLKADDNFDVVNVIKIENKIPIRGFSSFKFLPGTNDEIIVALKTEEFKGDTATYITAFTITGEILLPDTQIAAIKFEGFEFV